MKTLYALATIAPLLLVALAALALPASSHAQLIDRFGVKAGVVSASASGEFSDEVSGDQFGRRTGWAASVFAEKQVLPFLSIVGEVGYTERGFTEKLDHEIQRGATLDDDPTIEATSQLNYLTIPVMAKLSYDVALLELYGMAGPQIDILLERDTGWFKIPTTYNDDPDRFRSFTGYYYDPPSISGTAGLGIATESWVPVRMFMEARYDFALTDSYLNDSFGPYEIRSNALTVVVGFAF